MRRVFKSVFLVYDRDDTNYRKDGRKREQTALERGAAVSQLTLYPPMSGTVPCLPEEAQEMGVNACMPHTVASP